MSDHFKEVVAMSEGEKEDEIRHIERIIRSKPFPYGTVTLSEIRSRVYPHIQYTTTLKDYGCHVVTFSVPHEGSWPKSPGTEKKGKGGKFIKYIDKCNHESSS